MAQTSGSRQQVGSPFLSEVMMVLTFDLVFFRRSLCLVLLCAPCIVQAASCRVVGLGIYVLFTSPKIKVSQYDPIGKVLWSETKTYSADGFRCDPYDSNVNPGPVMVYTPTFSGSFNSENMPIQRTNISGVGFTVKDPDTGKYWTHSHVYFGIDWYFTMDGTGRPLPPRERRIQIDYYRTRESVGSGGTLNTPLGASAISHATVVATQTAIEFNNGWGQVIVENPTCDISVGDLNKRVKLNPVRAHDFRDTPGIGTTEFSIRADQCRLGAIAATFTFANGTPDPANPLIFKNTSVGGATGVGIRLFTGADETIGANGTNNSRRVTITGGSATLPLKAQYYKTGASVGKGAVESQVRLNMSYN
nr:fimbrial protein [Luteibacter sp. Sphag1AF]